MRIEKFTDIRGAGKWALLAVVYALLAFAYLMSRWEFWYAIPYILGFIGVAIVLSEEKAKVLTALCAALIGVLSVVVSQYTIAGGQVGGPSYALAATESIAVISIVLFVVLIASEYGFIDIGGKESMAKYLVLAALLAWAVWAFDYFRARLAFGSPLPLETILNHGGIMLLSINEALAMIGIKYKNQDVISVVFALAACLGAFLLVTSLGWGLGLLP